MYLNNMFVEAEIKLHVIYTTAEEKIDLCCPSTTPFSFCLCFFFLHFRLIFLLWKDTQISSPTDQVVAHLMIIPRKFVA
ncbi:CLUMA_CG014780, isoform A [Clunio marinus]|uniref:CLUMA_CG014780, isoform A n=1 Tax=Clunio marinus TaxID=568069 RepID=A0A1J1ISW7_9DIPT|nr:CLUMA_CG014780, isoform A [Clunio marinus]